MPCPNTAPEAMNELPWSTMLVAVGFSPFVENTTVSFDSEAVPVEVSCAPPVADELSHPRGAPEGGLLHGQISVVPGVGWHMSTPGDVEAESSSMSSIIMNPPPRQQGP